MLTHPAHTNVKINDKMFLIARPQSVHKSNQKTLKKPCRTAGQTLKLDTPPWQLMPKQILFTAMCFDSIRTQQVLGTWFESGTGRHGSQIRRAMVAHVAGVSRVGCCRGHRTRTKRRAGNTRHDHLARLSTQPAELAAMGRARPLEWPGLRPEHRHRQPLVKRSHRSGGARNPSTCTQRSRSPNADDAQLPLSYRWPEVLIRVWFFV